LAGAYVIFAGPSPLPGANTEWLEGGDWVQGPYAPGDVVSLLVPFDGLPKDSVIIVRGFYRSAMHTSGILMAGSHDITGLVYHGIASSDVKLSVRAWNPHEDQGALHLLTTFSPPYTNMICTGFPDMSDEEEIDVHNDEAPPVCVLHRAPHMPRQGPPCGASAAPGHALEHPSHAYSHPCCAGANRRNQS
jgi:hypothetical protein